MHALDVRLFHWINDWDVRWRALFVFFSETTKETPTRIGIAIVVLLLLAAGPTTRRAVLIGMVSVILANTLSDGLKHAFHVLRPCIELNDLTLRVGRLDSYGTASSHSANMAALALVFVYYFKWWGTPWILVAILTGLARIYVGVHYPSQVLLGYACGLVCALVVIKSWEAFVKVRRHRKELDASEPTA